MQTARMAGLFAAAALGCLACDDEAPAIAPAPTPIDAGLADTGPGVEPDAGTILDAGPPDLGAWDLGPPDLGAVDLGTDAGVDAGVVDAGPPPPTHVVRFVALGDTGEGNTAQYEVSRVIETVCMVQGCDFAVLLGDNFYDDGVQSPEDEQFQTKFEAPYANLQLQFNVTLGNHDFGEIPLQFWRTDHQITYSAMSSKWNMPDHFYTFVQDHVTFISLDTNMIMLGLDWVRDQRDWFEEQVDRAATPWIIAYGHHPYHSNGRHGNAGNYEGVGRIDPTGIVSGRSIKSFFEDQICGNVDLYLAGHDHNLQWQQPTCGTEMIVSGAGAKTTEFVNRDGNPTPRYASDADEGFFWIELADDVMTVEVWGRDGMMHYTNTVTRTP